MDTEMIYIAGTRAIECETREVREGNSMILQGRSNSVNIDGTIEYGEWITTGTIPNYGDCFDKKASFWQRIFGSINS